MEQPLPEIEYKATWIELFFDLVFVALVAQMTYHFSYHHSTITDFLKVLIVGYMIFYAWWGTTVNRNLKQKDDLIDTLAMQAQMLLVIVMSLTLPQGFGALSWAFFGSFTLHGFISLAMIRRLYRNKPSQKPQTLNVWWGFFVGYCLWAVAGILEGINLYIFAFLGLATLLLTPETKGKGNTITRINMSHFLERMGLFLLVVMGEAVLVVALVNTAAEQLDIHRLVIVICGLLQMIALWWLYYPYIEGKGIGKRARWFNVLLHSHGVLYGSLIFIATGLKLVLKDPASYHDDIWVFIFGIGLMIVAFNSIRISMDYPARKTAISLLTFFIGFALIVALSQTLQWSALILVGLVTIYLSAYTIIENRRRVLG